MERFNRLAFLSSLENQENLATLGLACSMAGIEPKSGCSPYKEHGLSRRPLAPASQLLALTEPVLAALEFATLGNSHLSNPWFPMALRIGQMHH